MGELKQQKREIHQFGDCGGEMSFGGRSEGRLHRIEGTLRAIHLREEDREKREGDREGREVQRRGE